VAEARGSNRREGFSATTLAVAAVASAVAAVVTSHFWKNGTVLTAAMTPVIVSIVKEGLQRPIQSDVVRRSATSARRVVAGGAAVRTADARESSPAAGAVPTPPAPNGANGELTQGDVLLTHPRRTYGGDRPPRRGFPLHGRSLKLAIVTGLLAFLVAAVVLTVPELVFGGAVSSGRTTFFGGQSSSTSSKKKDTNSQKQQTTPSSTTPAQTTPSSTTPQTTTPSQSQTTPQPQATPPPTSGGATPAPQQTPAPSTPTP
jgi:hypothetical protein